jgi:hypothetical protein
MKANNHLTKVSFEFLGNKSSAKVTRMLFHYIFLPHLYINARLQGPSLHDVVDICRPGLSSVFFIALLIFLKFKSHIASSESPG